MKSLVPLFVLLLVGLCALAEGSKHHRGAEPLMSRFAALDEIKQLSPKHRQLLERAVASFESTIDKSKLDPAHKDAVKQKSLDHFVRRLGERKPKGHGH